MKQASFHQMEWWINECVMLFIHSFITPSISPLIPPSHSTQHQRRIRSKEYLPSFINPATHTADKIRFDNSMTSKTNRMIKYLSQEGPASPKHATWKHPTLVLTLHYILSTSILVLVHDGYLAWLGVSSPPHHSDTTIDIQSSSSRFRLQQPNTQIANAIFLYFIFLITYRFLQNGNSSNMISSTTTRTKHKPKPKTKTKTKTKRINKHQAFQIACLYEYTFLCNTTLFHAYLCITTNRPLLATSHLITVSIDQVLWYIDLLGWSLSGFNNTKFPIGVAKYITWEGTSWATRVTCTHHLWTIPLVGYACGGIYEEAFPLSAVVMVVNVLLSRWLTPKSILYHDEDYAAPEPLSLSSRTRTRSTCGEDEKKVDGDITNTTTSTRTNKGDGQLQHKYLNVNLSHELWKDITFDFLQIQHDDPPVGVYLWRLLWRWQVLNGIVFFAVLRPFSKWCLE